MKDQTIWITGAGGLIGSHIVGLAAGQSPNRKIIGLTRQMVDLRDRDAITRQFKADRPTLLIHCAALSHSGRCEQDPGLAQSINVEVTRHLCELFADGRMVFFSTDLVFDGIKGDYTENDTPNPLGVYAQTKVEAEAIVRDHPNHVIVRTSLNGGVSPSGGRGFNEALQHAWREGNTTPLFVDEYRSPIPAPVTARATWELALSEVHGTFHVAGAERLNRAQIGELVARRHPELTALIQPCSLRDYTGPPRPPDCSLSIAKAQRHLSFQIPGLSGWLESNPHEPF